MYEGLFSWLEFREIALVVIIMVSIILNLVQLHITEKKDMEIRKLNGDRK